MLVSQPSSLDGIDVQSFGFEFCHSLCFPCFEALVGGGPCSDHPQVVSQEPSDNHGEQQQAQCHYHLPSPKPELCLLHPSQAQTSILLSRPSSPPAAKIQMFFKFCSSRWVRLLARHLT